jgi:hypothetical protein
MEHFGPDIPREIKDALYDVVRHYVRDEARHFLERPSDTHILHSLKAIYLWAFAHSCEADTASFAKNFLNMTGGDDLRERMNDAWGLASRPLNTEAVRSLNETYWEAVRTLNKASTEAEMHQALAEFWKASGLPQ